MGMRFLSIVLYCIFLAFPSTSLKSKSNPYDLTDIESSPYHLSGNLVYNSTRAGEPSKLTIQLLKLTLTFDTASIFRLKITDPFNQRFEVPSEVIQDLTPSESYNYNFTYCTSPFGLNVFRESDNVSILNISPYEYFQYHDQDIIFTSIFSENRSVYGLGERVSPSFKLAPGIYTIFNKDQSSPIDDGTTGGKNMYGSHPFYLSTDSNHTAIGGFLLNINAMDVKITETSITYRTIGGVIDFFGVSGASSKEVIRQYHSLIGYPTPPPYWAMGWHQSRYGYPNLDKWISVVKEYNKHNLPLDGFWTDIDYMDQFRDWTVDEANYPIEEVKKFVKELHEIDKKFVVILDAAVAMTEKGEYDAFDEGMGKDVFVRSPYEDEVELCRVWPGDAAFIDWFHPNASDYWIQQTHQFHSLLDFDGIWLDMNEATNFCNGQCDHEATIINNKTLPYSPGITDLNTLSMDMASPHYGSSLNIEYNVHNLYPYFQSKATSQFFTSKLSKRPFILSRSSMPGSNRYSIHWSGDNWSNFDYMGYSIGGIFNYGMFGFPMMGADICGFNNDTSQEVCSRWMQLGTLYPFARNHNMKGQRDQEPWTFNSTHIQTSEMAIRLRYKLVHYIYSHLFLNSLEGGMVFKPTFFAFPDDELLYNNHLDDNFMLGDGLIVHPVLKEGADSVNGYFPKGVWYEFIKGDRIESKEGKVEKLEAKLPGLIPVHVRGGCIIPTLDAWNTALNVQTLRKSTISLIIALNSGKANGFLIFDDLESPYTILNKTYTRVDYNFSTSDLGLESTLEISTSTKGYIRKPWEFSVISHIHIYGCHSEISQVLIKFDSVSSPLKTSLSYESSKHICHISFHDAVVPDLDSSLIFNYNSVTFI